MASYNEPYYDTDPATKGYVDKIKGELDTTTEEISANRSRNFGSQPTPPYYINDTYMNGTAIYVCKTSRLYGNFISSDWELASNYDNTQSIVDGGITTTTGTFQVGDTNNTIKAGITAYGSGDSSVRLWAGNTLANRNSAPFRVTQAGYLYANNANIKGAIYADYGTIGGFTLDSTKLYSGSGSGRAGIGVIGSEYAFWAGGETSSTAPFHVGHDGSIVATKGTIGGCSINNGVLSIANANIDSLTVDKITSGTNGANLTFNGNVTCKNLNANSGGTIGGFSIGSNILNGTGRDGTGTMYIRNGSNASVNFAGNGGRLTIGPSTSSGVQLTSAGVGGSGALCISDSYGESGSGSSSATIGIRAIYGGIRIAAGSSSSNEPITLTHNNGGLLTVGTYVRAGNCIFSASDLISNNNNSCYITLHNSIVLHGSNGRNAYIESTTTANQIATASGGPSSRNIKTNIKPICCYDDIYNDLQNLDMYDYDYKYIGVKNNKSDFGFIIDDIENSPTLSKYYRNFNCSAYINKDNFIYKSKDYKQQKDDKEINYKEWDRDSYIKMNLVLIKALQEKIDKLEERIVELEGGK